MEAMRPRQPSRLLKFLVLVMVVTTLVVYGIFWSPDKGLVHRHPAVKWESFALPHDPMGTVDRYARFGKEISDTRLRNKNSDTRLGNENSDTSFRKENSDMRLRNEISDTRLGNEKSNTWIGNENSDARVGKEKSNTKVGNEKSNSRLGNENNDTKLGHKNSDARHGKENSDARLGKENSDARLGNKNSGTRTIGEIDTTSTRAPPSHSHTQQKTRHIRDHFNQTMSSQRVQFGPDLVSTPTRYLIYRCDAGVMSPCGGWADRVKGVLSGYLLANLTGRLFKIEMLSPSCDILRLVQPNQIDWRLPHSFHRVVNKSQDVQIVNLVDNIKFYKKIRAMDFQTLPAMKAKYVYYKSNLDFMMELKNSVRYKRELSWMNNLTRDEINAAVFKRLFKIPSKAHENLSIFFSKHLQPRDKLLCAHVRTGRNPSNPNDSVRRVKDEHLARIWAELRNVSRGRESYKIFLMSDSQSVIANAKRQSFADKLITDEGRIVHMEKTKGISRNEICAGVERVVLDQFILMHCDVLFISKSGLGRMAAYVRESDQGLYCILLDGRVVPCQKSKLQEIYHING